MEKSGLADTLDYALENYDWNIWNDIALLLLISSPIIILILVIIFIIVLFKIFK